MKRKITLTFSLSLFLLFFSISVYAEPYYTYPPYYLAKLGIDLKQFKIGAFSGNNRTLVCVEKINNIQLRAKGYVWILRILNINSYNQIIGYRSVILHITDLNNLAVNHNGKTVIIIAQYGTKILKVNLLNGKTTTLFYYQPGKPGFRCSSIIWHYKHHFYTQGYYYGRHGYWISSDIVRLDISYPNSIKLFHKTWNIHKAIKSLGKMVAEIIVSGKEGFIDIRNTLSSTTLYDCTPKTCEPLDHALAYGGWAATGHRILYAALNKTGNTSSTPKRSLIIKSTKPRKTWLIYSGEKAYLYPYLSKNGGRTAVVATINFKNGLMSYYYAKEKNNFKLKPFPHLQNVPLGIFRLSPNGKHYAFLNRDGLIIGTLP